MTLLWDIGSVCAILAFIDLVLNDWRRRMKRG